MLYSEQHNLVFVHIPKNAGSSLKTMISKEAAYPRQQFDADTQNVGVTRPDKSHYFNVCHPALGDIKIDHLPLHVLNEHFPSLFALVRDCESFAICRDPRERFVSALFQRLREFRSIDASDISRELLREEAQAVCSWLGGRDRYTDVDYIHFCRQSDFIYLDGKQIVDHVFSISDMDSVLVWLKEKLEMPALEIERTNESVQVAGWFQSIHKTARPVYHAIFPKTMREAIYPIFKSSFLTKLGSKGESEFQFSDQVERFILDYYAADFDLYHRAEQSGSRAVA